MAQPLNLDFTAAAQREIAAGDSAAPAAYTFDLEGRAAFRRLRLSISALLSRGLPTGIVIFCWARFTMSSNVTRKPKPLIAARWRWFPITKSSVATSAQTFAARPV